MESNPPPIPDPLPVVRMAAISMLNPKAEVARAGQTLAVNMGGARGIQVGCSVAASTNFVLPRTSSRPTWAQRAP